MKHISLALVASIGIVSAYTPHAASFRTQTAVHYRHDIGYENIALLSACAVAPVALTAVSLLENGPLTKERHAVASTLTGLGCGATAYVLGKFVDVVNRSEMNAPLWGIAAALVAGGAYYAYRPGWRRETVLKRMKNLFKKELDISLAALPTLENDLGKMEACLIAAASLESKYQVFEGTENAVHHVKELKAAAEEIAYLRNYPAFENDQALIEDSNAAINNINKGARITREVKNKQNGRYEIQRDAYYKATGDAERLRIQALEATAQDRLSRAARQNANANQQHADAHSSEVMLDWLKWIFGSR